MTASRPAAWTGPPVQDRCECESAGSTCGAAPAPSAQRDLGWASSARQAWWLAWASLVWMAAEGAIGLWQGAAAGSVALTGWALGSAVEGLASAIVVWRFTGARTLSPDAERRAQRAVAVSFWLLAPYIAARSVQDLTVAAHPRVTVIGMALTATALVVMPVLGRAKRTLGKRLGSAATAGEGAQNYLCAAQAAAVLAGLAATAAWPGGWWLDPVIGLGVAAAAVREGRRSWRGDECC